MRLTTDDEALIREWDARLRKEGLAMSRGLPPRRVTLVTFQDELHSPGGEDGAIDAITD